MAYALITGASSGIGLELARVFAAHGHDVILVARSAEKLDALAAELMRDHHVTAVSLPCDLSEPDAAERLHKTTCEAGYAVDNLVNSAGFGDWAGFLDSDWDRQAQMVQVNVTALMQMTYLYGNDMRDAGFGHILNLSSVAAFYAGPYMADYYASKGYVLQFSEAVAEELRGTGVTVTALCPGPTRSGFEAGSKMGKGARMFKVLPASSSAAVARRGYAAMQRGRHIVQQHALIAVMNVWARVAPRRLAAVCAEFVNGHPHDPKGFPFLGHSNEAAGAALGADHPAGAAPTEKDA